MTDAAWVEILNDSLMCQLSEDDGYETGYNKNNNFDKGQISRTCILGAQNNCVLGRTLLSSQNFFNTKLYVLAEIKEKLQVNIAHNIGLETAHQRYALSMAYPWWTVGGSMLCASWDMETL